MTGGDDTNNDGTFNWVIPDDVSDDVLIQIVDSDDVDGDDFTDTAFSIAGDLQMQVQTGTDDAPLGGETWSIYRATPAQLAVAQDNSMDIFWNKNERSLIAGIE